MVFPLFFISLPNKLIAQSQKGIYKAAFSSFHGLKFENKVFCIILAELIEFFCSLNPMYISEMYSVKKLEIVKGFKKKNRQSSCHSWVIKSLGHLWKFLLAEQYIPPDIKIFILIYISQEVSSCLGGP